MQGNLDLFLQIIIGLTAQQMQHVFKEKYVKTVDEPDLPLVVHHQVIQAVQVDHPGIRTLPPSGCLEDKLDQLSTRQGIFTQKSDRLFPVLRVRDVEPDIDRTRDNEQIWLVIDTRKDEQRLRHHIAKLRAQFLILTREDARIRVTVAVKWILDNKFRIGFAITGVFVFAGAAPHLTMIARRRDQGRTPAFRIQAGHVQSRSVVFPPLCTIIRNGHRCRPFMTGGLSTSSS